ncbi:stage VI sporulation protein F [Camelliibacillus cellulosilyticus]|uniref:Stage VI sporulation protein F n=1 Tax=Camelliibacillus cellulosilyticus TaxID=2174486 RepID=A0ABV9GHQ0_9BACL
MDPNHPFFDSIEKKTNVKREDIFALAQSLANANFQDEATVRGIVHRVAKMANVSVPKEKEDKIVKAVVNNNVPLNFSSLAKMFNQK